MRTLLVTAAAVVVSAGIACGGFIVWLSSATTPGTVLIYQTAPQANAITAYDAVPALTNRLGYGPGGRARVRAVDDSHIEITLPSTDAADIAWVKHRVSSAGVLRFAILANPRDHAELIATAELQSQAGADVPAMVVDEGAAVEGHWAGVGREPTVAGVPGNFKISLHGMVARDHDSGRMLEIPSGPQEGDATDWPADWLKAQGVVNVDVLTVHETNMRVGGEDLIAASRSYDSDESPAISFTLSDSGSKQFYRLTLTYKPEGAFKRRLGIVMDDVLLSAPSINSPIRSSGVISGSFSQEEVDQIVDLLYSGQLPLSFEKTPSSEQTQEVPLQLADVLPGF